MALSQRNTKMPSYLKKMIWVMLLNFPKLLRLNHLLSLVGKRFHIR